MSIIQLFISNAVLSDFERVSMVKPKNQMIMESDFEIKEKEVKGKLNGKRIFEIKAARVYRIKLSG